MGTLPLTERPGPGTASQAALDAYWLRRAVRVPMENGRQRAGIVTQVLARPPAAYVQFSDIDGAVVPLWKLIVPAAAIEVPVRAAPVARWQWSHVWRRLRWTLFG